MPDNSTKTAVHGQITKSDFHPPYWAKNRHLQTLWPRFIKQRLQVSHTMQRMELPDGDFIDLSWSERPQTCKGIAVIFHGLEGGITSQYAIDTMATLFDDGWHVVLMHFRGCSGEINRLPRAYHSGATEDPLYLLSWLHEKYPEDKKVAIGFSLGGNMLLKLLGEDPHQRILSAAVSVSAPLKLNECANAIREGFSQRYQDHLLTSMKQTLKAKMRRLDYSGQLSLAYDDIDTLNTFWDFDEHVTAPLHGYHGAQDYYRQCSAFYYLKYINVPTLIIHAQDDPFMNSNVIPEPTDLSSSVLMEVSQHGGHVGFVNGSPWSSDCWYLQRMKRFYQSVLA